jgi:hypothetical protein
VRADLGPRGGRGGKCGAAKRRWRSRRIWTSASADARESVLSVAGSARFRRRVRVQGNGPRASRLRASDVRAVQEQCAGDATGPSDPAGGYAGVPTVFLQHTRVSSGALAHEQENPEVHGGVGIANQSGSIILSFGPRHPATPFPRRSSEQNHNTSRKLLDSLIELF